MLTDGNVFEKAGVNLSVVYGQMPQEALQAATERGADRAGGKLEPGQKVPFFACGLSSVMHPKNPFCPTMHFNYRYFETESGAWWFGGGTDITPSYLDLDDMKHFHGTYKDVCDKYNPEWYPKFKSWADDYFLIKHRGETRGLGGIFFDDLNTEDPETHLKFAEEALDAVPKAYVPILEKNRDKEFTEEQKQWQLLRRGRYVEFNLVYDRGTVFGLKMLGSGVGRIESILMSLPENASWLYAHEPKEGSPEAEIMEAFKQPKQWVWAGRHWLPLGQRRLRKKPCDTANGWARLRSTAFSSVFELQPEGDAERFSTAPIARGVDCRCKHWMFSITSALQLDLSCLLHWTKIAEFRLIVKWNSWIC